MHIHVYTINSYHKRVMTCIQTEQDYNISLCAPPQKTLSNLKCMCTCTFIQNTCTCIFICIQDGNGVYSRMSHGFT